MGGKLIPDFVEANGSIERTRNGRIRHKNRRSNLGDTAKTLLHNNSAGSLKNTFEILQHSTLPPASDPFREENEIQSKGRFKGKNWDFPTSILK
jgi:hypothetical protein